MAKNSRQSSFNFQMVPAAARAFAFESGRSAPRAKRAKRAARGAGGRIDDSHQPFKRTRQLGPGPKRAPAVRQVREWECQKGREKYTQVCTYVGPDLNKRGKKVKSKMNAKKKKAYNKVYRAWAKANRAGLHARGPLPSYRCKRTRVAKCK